MSRSKDSSSFGGFFNSSTTDAVCSAFRGSGGIPREALSCAWFLYSCNINNITFEALFGAAY
jgi:hypothetical protein